MKCGIYTRVSTDTQSEIKFNSCESQKEQIIAFIKTQTDMEAVKYYEDAGYSGSNLNRPGLQNLLHDISKGLIDSVLVYKIDRLTRSPKDFYHLMEQFDKYGVSFVSTTQRFDTSTATGRLIRNIMLDFAQFEREMTVERTKDKMYQRARKGLWNGGIPPFGYDRKEKKLVINEQEAACVREAFDAFLQTRSLAAVRKRINSKYKTRAGKAFSKSSIFVMLRSAAYAGKMNYGDQQFQGEHEPIVSEGKFFKAQSLMKESEPRTETKIDREYLLTGLIRCQECGSIMTPTYTKKTGKNGKPEYVYYYRCTKTYQENWKACPIKSVNAVRMEKWVLEKLKAAASEDGVIRETVERINQEEGEKVRELKAEDARLAERQEHLKIQSENLVKALAEGGVRFGQIQAKLEELEASQKVIGHDREEIKTRIDRENLIRYDAELVVKNLRDMAGRFDSAPDAEKKNLLQLSVKEIKYGREAVAIELLYLPAIVNHYPNGSKNRSELLPGLIQFRTVPLRFLNTVNFRPVPLESQGNGHYRGQIPYGFIYLENELVSDQEEQKTIQLIKMMRDSAKPLRAIAGELNRREIPTKNNGVWQANTVKKILDRLN
jgi:site-specific DNA recombinase